MWRDDTGEGGFWSLRLFDLRGDPQGWMTTAWFIGKQCGKREKEFSVYQKKHQAFVDKIRFFFWLSPAASFKTPNVLDRAKQTALFFWKMFRTPAPEHRRRWRARWNKRENRQRKRWKFSLQREYRRWDVLIKSKRNTLLPETCLKVCRFGFVCLLLPLPVPKISDFIFII